MENNNVERKFVQMLENIDVRMFLKASPLESGERSKLDKVLSNEMYYSTLYANSNAADEKCKELLTIFKCSVDVSGMSSENRGKVNSDIKPQIIEIK